jgi:ATP-dependent protease Clp ATPase subunit
MGNVHKNNLSTSFREIISSLCIFFSISGSAVEFFRIVQRSTPRGNSAFPISTGLLRFLEYYKVGQLRSVCALALWVYKHRSLLLSKYRGDIESPVSNVYKVGLLIRKFREEF